MTNTKAETDSMKNDWLAKLASSGTMRIYVDHGTCVIPEICKTNLIDGVDYRSLLSS